MQWIITAFTFVFLSVKRWEGTTCVLQWPVTCDLREKLTPSSPTWFISQVYLPSCNMPFLPSLVKLRIFECLKFCCPCPILLYRCYGHFAYSWCYMFGFGLLVSQVYFVNFVFQLVHILISISLYSLPAYTYGSPKSLVLTTLHIRATPHEF